MQIKHLFKLEREPQLEQAQRERSLVLRDTAGTTDDEENFDRDEDEFRIQIKDRNGILILKPIWEWNLKDIDE